MPDAGRFPKEKNIFPITVAGLGPIQINSIQFKNVLKRANSIQFNSINPFSGPNSIQFKKCSFQVQFNSIQEIVQFKQFKK